MPNVIGVCVQMSSPRCVTQYTVCVVEFSTLSCWYTRFFEIHARCFFTTSLYVL